MTSCYHLRVMRRWRTLAAIGLAGVAGTVVVVGLMQFLAPEVAYHVRDRAREWLRGQKTYRIGLGATTGASSQVARVLNRLLREKAGYELELVNRQNGTLASGIGSGDELDLAMANSAADDLLATDGAYALAALEPQHFYVIVPNDSPVQEFRELTGAVNPGARRPEQPATLGERVLEYYGLTGPGDASGPRTVTIVRPKAGTNLQDFESGHMVAATRTQSPHSELIEGIMRGGGYRLVPIKDHASLAKAIPGTSAAFIPTGLYGPGRRIPAEPVPTLSVTMLLVASGRVPGRVVRDVLDALYDPRFAREMHYDITEATGRNVGGFPLHPAAEIYYHRNDLVTSDRLGRLSFVGSAFVALAALAQFLVRHRRNERVRNRRRLLGDELARLDAIRRQFDGTETTADTRQLLRDADDLLAGAEQDAAAELLDADGIDSIRSMHQLCMQAAARRLSASASAG
jgi:TRAP-type uncharacterized transport system substrate-binding protein